MAFLIWLDFNIFIHLNAPSFKRFIVELSFARAMPSLRIPVTSRFHSFIYWFLFQKEITSKANKTNYYSHSAE